MMKNNGAISFSTPYDAQVDISTYIESVKSLIKKERESDQTIVLHTDEEIRSKYTSSMIAILDGKIIGNSSIYPTKMKPLNDLVLDGKKICVGESGSVIIHPDYRGHGLGRKITTKALEILCDQYDIIVGATVNDIMFTLRTHQGFETIPFPRELYEEGKKHLAPFMLDGAAEFERRAKCMMYNIKLTQDQKNNLIDILKKEHIGK